MFIVGLIEIGKFFPTILADSFIQEEVNGEKRNVMKFDPKIAPITAAVFRGR